MAAPDKETSFAKQTTSDKQNSSIESASSPVFQSLQTWAGYPYPRKYYIGRIAWNLVQATIFRWSFPRAYNWRRWLLRLFGAHLAENTHIRGGAKIFHPWLLYVDEWTTIAGGVTVYNLGPIHVGRHTVISQNTYLCAGTHDYTQSDLPLMRPPIHIGSGVWIAAAAFIGPGVNIGDNSVIGACSVVFKDIPAGVVVAGNPAVVIKPRKMISEDNASAATEKIGSPITPPATS